MALLGGAEAAHKSLSDRAKEEDELASGTGSTDKDIGSLQGQKELRPENFENLSITSMSDAIKHKSRQEKIRNEINTKENKNKALYQDIENKLKDKTLIAEKMELTMNNPAESLVGQPSPPTNLAGTHEEHHSASSEYSG
jgi:hypothetical protein